MRLDAAPAEEQPEAAPAPAPGEWARRYRRMHAQYDSDGQTC
jgi:hypothetical protein